MNTSVIIKIIKEDKEILLYDSFMEIKLSLYLIKMTLTPTQKVLILKNGITLLWSQHPNKEVSDRYNLELHYFLVLTRKYNTNNQI